MNAKCFFAAVLTLVATGATANDVSTEYVAETLDYLLSDARCDDVSAAFDAVGRRMLGSEDARVTARDEVLYFGAMIFEKGYASGPNESDVAVTQKAISFCQRNPGALFIEAFQ